MAVINVSIFDNDIMKRAILMAKEANAQLHFLYAVDIPIMDIDISSKYLNEKIDEQKIKKELSKKIATIEGAKDFECFIHVSVGDVSEQVIEFSHKIRANLIIIGSSLKMKVEDYYLGSLANTLAQKGSLPILVIKNSADGYYKNILAPTDLSENSKKAILFSKVVFSKTPINLVFAYDDIDDLTIEYQELDSGSNDNEHIFLGRSHLDIFKQDLSIDRIDLIRGPLSINENLINYINNFHSDLIILGSAGSGLLGSYLGSTATYLLRNIDSDILLYIPEQI